jgi:ABC-type transport system involved in Fe-S cluster assembly fused permease/ATPase subunit
MTNSTVTRCFFLLLFFALFRSLTHSEPLSSLPPSLPPSLPSLQGTLSRVIDRGGRSINYALTSMLFNVVPTAI